MKDDYYKTVNSIKKSQTDPVNNRPWISPHFEHLRFMDKLQDSNNDDNKASIPVAKKRALKPDPIIEEIQRRPILWDKSKKIYLADKDRSLKIKAWREVTEKFEPDFDKMDESQKKEAGKNLVFWFFDNFLNNS